MSSPTQQPTLYDILGVPNTATDEEIRRAYRKKAFELHPDRNQSDPQATEKFQQLGEAYAILKDPESRDRYDRFGINGETPTEPGDVEIFEMMTQILGLGRSRGPPVGDKVSPTIRFFRISLKEAYLGLEAKNTIKIHKVCPECHGTGSNDGIEYPMCDVCHGAGSLSPGGLQFLFPCEKCNNVGYILPPEKVCKKCHGHKIITAKKVIKIKTEIGQQEGEQIILPNEGDEYPGKISADLVLITQMKYDFDFQREGDDLYFVEKVSRIEAKTGTAFVIKTPDGRELHVKTPKNKEIRFDRVMWLQGEGMPCKGNPTFKGNLYIFFKFGFPGLITESVRTIAGLICRTNADIVLQEAPEDIQENFRRRAEEFIRQQEEAYRTDHQAE
ncbi:DnaJ domain containing protein [Tritrichomonas foetus]|uniref:DnaJ domain containing protein n=1 Tax=Tritrichomonas foetus TaxID=1144522 RepID=A0A1J4KW51_9EUKA|nr:DnaJ domain containing protein [Tritrichomonas foetus]|eukprot:OHT13741.1 DnaJ domain containing protein [Tritrichomonas foetus]